MSCYGLIGAQLSHSFSPQLHQALWGADYDLLAMDEDAVRAFFVKRAFAGVNVTIPYKQLALSLCDEVDVRAARIGAVNTVVNRGGRLYGYNTDYAGMQRCLALAEISLTDKKVLICGSGGTGRTARAVAVAAGARSIVTLSRSGPDTYENLACQADAEILLHTTPLGMYPNTAALALDPILLPQLTGVLDAIYNPLATRLVQKARRLGIPASGGLAMLVEQARAAAALFLGEEIPETRAAQVLADLCRSQSNLVLIGMPGCGKTTVGRLLAKRLKRPFIDLDLAVEQTKGKSIPAVFAEEGEAVFRQAERIEAQRYGMQHGLVIACGGGTPLTEDNQLALGQNGHIYYLARPLHLLSSEGRPLSSSPEAVRSLYDKRHPIYAAFCDLQVEGNGPPEQVAACIEEDFFA